MSAPSVRAAALAFALSSWAEGLTLVRTVLLTPYLPGSGFTVDQRVSQESPSLPGNWKDRILAWFKHNGREMDDAERSLLALVDVSTALLLMQALDQPLPPFLLSPLLTNLPLPRSTGGFKPIKWHYVFLATIFLSMAHEAERAAVSSAVEFVRKLRETRNKNLLGEVFARGAEHYPTEYDEEEDEQECLICAGVGPETSLSQSISSISSLATTSQANANALGPLEAFCTTAPQKHVVHRSCFLTWHTAYRQQRIHLPPEQVELEDCKDEGERTRAASILDAAGFGHLSRHLRLPHELSWTAPMSTPSPARSTLTLINDAADSLSSSATRSTLKYLARLHTSIPPCPGCRSSVMIRFFSRPVIPQRNMRPPTHRERIKFIPRLWIKHWSELVTGKTVLYRLISQWSFVIALVSMMRVSGDRSRFRWTFI